jgi:hypothetical protein
MMSMRGRVGDRVLLSIGAAAAWLALGTPAGAQGFDGGCAIEEPPPVKIRELTGPEAETWVKLNQKLSLPFQNETPLVDVLGYLAEATSGGQEKGGVQFFLDPQGLLEAEKTPQTPVQITLNEIPARTGLRLLLDQLDMEYVVTTEGVVVITTPDRIRRFMDPATAVVEKQAEVHALRSEVARLREELARKGQAERPVMGRVFPEMMRDMMTTGVGGRGAGPADGGGFK